MVNFDFLNTAKKERWCTFKKVMQAHHSVVNFYIVSSLFRTSINTFFGLYTYFFSCKKGEKCLHSSKIPPFPPRDYLNNVAQKKVWSLPLLLVHFSKRLFEPVPLLPSIPYKSSYAPQEAVKRMWKALIRIKNKEILTTSINLFILQNEVRGGRGYWVKGQITEAHIHMHHTTHKSLYWDVA